MNILLPVTANTVDYIRLGGMKHIYISDFKKEYRALRKEPTKLTVFLYINDPINKLVGYIGISKLVLTRPTEAWKYTSNYSCMTEVEFMEKYGESKNIYVLFLEEKFNEFAEPIAMNKICVDFVEPKTYQKLDVLEKLL